MESRVFRRRKTNTKNDIKEIYVKKEGFLAEKHLKTGNDADQNYLKER